MTFALIFLIVDGLVLGIQSNQMNKLIPNEMKHDHDDYNLKAGILTIFIGAGSMIGSYISGPATDGFGLKCFGKTTILSYVLTCVLTVAAALYKVSSLLFNRLIGLHVSLVSCGDSFTTCFKDGSLSPY